MYVEAERAEEALPHLISHAEYLKSRDPNNDYMKFISQSTLGRAFVKVQRPKDGLHFCSEALDIGDKMGELAGTIDCELCLGEGFLKTNQLDSAEYYSLAALEVAQDINSIERRTKSNLLLSKVYEAKEDYESSVKYLKQFNALNDTLFANTKSRQMARLRTEAETDVQIRENKLLQAKLENARLQALLFGVGVLIVLALAIIFYRNYRKNLSYSKELEDKVSERTTELNESNQGLVYANKELQQVNSELQQVNAELQQFAYVASHDLKEPIKNILGFSEMIQRKLNNGNGNGHFKQDINNYVNYITKGAKRMSTLVEAVTDYTKVNKEKRNFSQIDVNELLDDVTDMLYNMIQKKDAQVIYGNLPRIMASEANLIIVFKNLIENAVKYNDHPNPKIEISYEEAAGFHRFTVSDNGIGVPAKYKDYIFELFRRLNPKASEGTGLGLAISKKVIQGMGGMIGLEQTEQEQGSTFYFTIPK